MAGAVDVITDAWREFFDTTYVTEYQLRRWASAAVRALQEDGWALVRIDGPTTATDAAQASG